MQETIYEVRVYGEGWVLRRRGRSGKARFSTREEAIARGREECMANRPSCLKVERKPGAEV
jgi:hypothetical protein